MSWWLLPEHLTLTSVDYPPYGSDLRKVSFNMPGTNYQTFFGSFYCILRWGQKLPDAYFLFDAIFGVYFTQDAEMSRILWGHQVPPPISGLERLWLSLVEDSTVLNNLTFDIDNGTLDYLINTSHAPLPNYCSLKIWRQPYPFYIPVFRPRKYEGASWMHNITDESG